jgi:LemA protein
MLGLGTAATATLVLLAGLLLGWIFATALRRQDHRTFVLSRAPRLPIRALAAHDDAWLRGTVHCAAPLRCPWFGVECVAFRYEREKKVTVTRKQANGNITTDTEWRTEVQESSEVDFVLDDGDRITVALADGSNEAMESLGTDYETTSRRHSAQVLPLGATVSVLGVRRDDGSFGPLAEVPLLVSSRPPEQRVQQAAGHETALFFLAVALPFVAAAVATGLWLDAGTWPEWLLAAAAGLVVAVPQWWLLTHNRLLRLRQQVRAAQQQIAIELAHRADLVPNLVAGVGAFAAHETGLLTRLAAIRREAAVEASVRAEAGIAATTRDLLVLHERQPHLTSDPLYRDLHERLWAIEEKIGHARTMYDDIVSEWNDRIAKVPSNLVARLCRHRPAPLFAAREAPLPRLPAVTT